MALVGYHAPHEQFSPRQLLHFAGLAKEAGFLAMMCSDHFHPWSNRQGQSGFAWSWLGAAMSQIELPFGVVTAPGYRYHPAIIAQAASTLAEMHPDRFWMAVGSGELLNEHIIGEKWPDKTTRNKKLQESVEVIRQLWLGESVTHHSLITVEEAQLSTLPPGMPKIIGAAITPQTAAWMGSWADGLITTTQPHNEHFEVAKAFRRGGGAGKPLLLQTQLSYAKDTETARKGAHDQWRNNIFRSSLLSELKTPAQFDAAAEFVAPDELDKHIRISADPKQHVKWIKQDIAFGFDEIYLHNVNRDQELFIKDFGTKVLSNLKIASS